MYDRFTTMQHMCVCCCVSEYKCFHLGEFANFTIIQNTHRDTQKQCCAKQFHIHSFTSAFHQWLRLCHRWLFFSLSVQTLGTGQSLMHVYDMLHARKPFALQERISWNLCCIFATKKYVSVVSVDCNPNFPLSVSRRGCSQLNLLCSGR